MKKKSLNILLTALVAALLIPTTATAESTTSRSEADWQAEIEKKLPKLAADLWGDAGESTQEGEYELFSVPVKAGKGEAAGWWAANPAQGFRVFFGEQGIRIFAGEPGLAPPPLGFRLLAYGREGDLHPVPEASRAAAGRRIEYRREALVEWYANEAAGLLQGFTLEEPLAGDAGELILELELEGGLEPALAKSGRTLVWSGAGSGLVQRGLQAVDAQGRALSARFELASSSLRIRIDDARAVFPVILALKVDQSFDLVPDDSALFDNFATSVAIDGNMIAIGAPMADLAFLQIDAGKIYVFRRDVLDPEKWVQIYKYLNDKVGEWLGWDVDISGDTLVAGAPLATVNGIAQAGKVVVFKNTGGDIWKKDQELTAQGDAQIDARFGTSVAIDGDVMVVGADLHDTGRGKDAGKVYVFERTSGNAFFTTKATLEASSGRQGDLFGDSVDVNSMTNTIVVGASKVDGNGWLFQENFGAAYIFERAGAGAAWPSTETRKLVSTPEGWLNEFGSSVAIDGGTVVVGAHLADGPLIDAGRAYVFEKSLNWQQSKVLAASDAAGLEQFGRSVAIEGDTIVVGSSTDSAPQFLSGSAFVYKRSGTNWVEDDKLTRTGSAAFDVAGHDVAYQGGTAVVSAHLDDIGINFEAGSAATYLLAQPPVQNVDLGIEVTAGTAQVTIPAMGSTTAQITVKVTNNDTVNGATGVEVDVTLMPTPPGVAVNPTADSGTDYSTPKWTIPSLAPGEQKMLVFEFTIDASAMASMLKLTGEITASTPADSNADGPKDAMIELVAAPPPAQLLTLTLTETMSPPNPLTGTDKVKYKLEVTNGSNVQADNVKISITLPSPPGVTWSTTPTGICNPACEWNVGNLASMDSRMLEVTADLGRMAAALVPFSIDIMASAKVDGTDDDTASITTAVGGPGPPPPPPCNNPDVKVTVETPSASVIVPVVSAFDVTYKVKASNRRPTEGTTVVINAALTLPAGVALWDFVEPAGTTWDFISGDWTIDSLPGGETRELEITIRVGVTAGPGSPIDVTATFVSMDQPDCDSGNNDDSATTGLSDAATPTVNLNLGVQGSSKAKKIRGLGLKVFTEIPLTVTVTNTGATDATGVIVVQDLLIPDGAALYDFTAPAGTSVAFPDSSHVEWTVGTVTASSTVVLELLFRVGVTATPGEDLSVLAELVTNEANTGVASASASALTESPDIFIDGFESGDTLSWTCSEPPGGCP